MRRGIGMLTTGVLLACSGSWAAAATVTGTVKGPDGAPFKGAFVGAQNKKTRMTVTVLSDKDGRYRVESLPEGSYDIRIRAVGYKTDPKSNVALTASQAAAFDFALEKGVVRWSDVSFYEGDNLLPESKTKTLMEQACLECHSFQTKMAAVARTREGYAETVSFMREKLAYRVRINDEQAADIAAWMSESFGQDAKLPRNVADMPNYQKFVHPPFPDESMKIVYVSYELPGSTRMPFSAAPDKDGNVWVPYFSLANAIARLNPKTGEVQEFKVPAQVTAQIHSAYPAPDGSVYLAEQATNRVGKWDPLTKEITEYQDAFPATPGVEARRGSKHTIRVDPRGHVWSSGSPLTEFDPVTKKFTHYPDVPSTYGIAIAKDGIVWWTDFSRDGKLGKVDPATGKVTKYTVPSKSAYPRRIQVDNDGMVWFAEFGIHSSDGVKYSDGGSAKIARFDPKTETFKEFPLPGPSPSPYAFGLDKNGNLWYANMHQDLVGRLDPKTGKVTEYPLPFSENTMREFFLDAEGRVWWGSPSNNKVGYFYIAETKTSNPAQ